MRASIALLFVLAHPVGSALAQAELTGTYVTYFDVGAEGRFMDALRTRTFQYTETGMMPFSCDFFSPGSPYEGFYVSTTAGGVASERSNTETGIQMTTVTATALAGRTITWSGRYVHASAAGAQLDIAQSVTYEVADRAVRVDVTLRNSGTVELTNVYYGRRGEPDHGSCGIGTSFITNNDVRRQPPTDATALMTAAAGMPLVVLGIGSFDTRARMSVGAWPPGGIAEVWTTPRDPGGLDEDTWIQWAFREATLAVGASTTFTFYYVFGSSVAQVEMRFDELGFPTAPCVGLAEGAMCTTSAGASGLCRAGVCCTGCFDGTRCQLGGSTTACGRAGAMCRSCADTDACTSDVCSAGACSNPSAPAGTRCDDSAFCTASDTCDGAGRCVGTGARCDDAESCTTDSCNETTDACTNAPRPDDTMCTRGSAGRCHSGICCVGCWDGAACQFGSAPSACGAGGGLCASCVDPDSCTVDLCTAGTCTNPRAPVGTLCDDGLFCTRTDSCDAAGACIGGGVPRCADGMDCTTDACDEDAGMCIFTPTMGCTIGGECVADGTVLVGNPCLVCDPAADMFDWSPRPAGSECGAPACMTGRIATRTCDAAGACVRTVAPCPTGECLDSMTCVIPCLTDGCGAGEWCDPTSMRCEPQDEEGAACTDPTSCLSGFCADGVCCESACDGVCEQCDGAPRGTCNAIGAGIDLDDECDSACDGMRACLGADAGRADGGGTTDGGGMTGDGGRRDAGTGATVHPDDGCGCRSVEPGSLALYVLAMFGIALRRRRR